MSERTRVAVNEAFAAVDVIRVKRDKGVLSDPQIDWVVDAYTRGVVADEQMAALAMAILLNGMSAAEIARWTAAMIDSGERLDLSGVDRPTVDKHSTGGVGDKITPRRCRSCPGEGSATPAARWTSWSRYRGSGRGCPTRSSWSSCAPSVPRSARPARGSRRPTASSTRYATSPAPSRRSR